jgi:hypothetical protein
MEGASAELRDVTAENDRERGDQARSRLVDNKHGNTLACKRAGGASGPLLHRQEGETPRVPLAFLQPGAPRGLTVAGWLPANIDEAELARIARRWR